ncbi:MAG: polysaccharide deacetylase family protein [Dongiaceae bacterium]
MSWRRTARITLNRQLGAALAGPVLGPLAARALRGSVKIAYAHYAGVPRPYLTEGNAMSVEMLAQRLGTLARHFEFVPLDSLLADCTRRAAARPDALAVTLDDGFDILREGAYEVFESFRVPVTTFVVVGSLDNERLIWASKLRAIELATGPAVFRPALVALQRRCGYPVAPAEAPALRLAALGWPMARKDELADVLWQACDMPPLPEYLDRHRPYHSWAQLAELRRRGHAVGLHTWSHPYCDRLDEAEIEAEIVRPAALLRERLGLEGVPLAYPFGVRLPPAAERRLAARGVISCALGIAGFSRRPAHPFALERASLEGDAAYNLLARPTLRRARAALAGGRV